MTSAAGTKRRTVFIASSWASTPTPRFCAALARNLAEQGHRAILLVDKRRTDVETDDGNFAVLTWPSERPVHVRDAVFLSKLILREKPDCLIANFGATNIMTLVGQVLRVRCRMVWQRTLSTQINLDHALSERRIRMMRLRRIALFKAATHVVANSAATRDDVRTTFRVPDEKCTVIHNSMEDAAPAVLALRGRDPELRIICVGRLEPSKNQAVILRAVARLDARFDTVKVELIGDGTARTELEALAKELGLASRCTFRGALDHDTVMSRVATASVAVVPSKSEAFGVVVIEPMSLGVPVVAAAVGGIPEIIRNDVDGYLFQPDDAGELAAHLERLLSSAELRTELGDRGRERFLDQFEQGACVRKFNRWLLDDVLAGS